MSSQSEYSEADLLISKIRGGDLEGLKSALKGIGLNTQAFHTNIYKSSEVEGCLLHHAIFYDHAPIIAFLFDAISELFQSPEAAAEATEPTFFAYRHMRYTALFQLLSKGVNPNQRRKVDGYTLLHLACNRNKPNATFVQQLVQIKTCDPNVTNDSGETPLHLLCIKCNTLAGREVATLLKAKGAALDIIEPKSRKTAPQLTNNPYIREVLTLCSLGRQRKIPEVVAETEEQKQRIMSDPLEIPKELLQSTEEEMARGKRLTTSEQEDLVSRLAGDSVKQKEKNLQKLVAHYVPEPQRNFLSADQLQDYASRHYYEQVELRKSKMQALSDKFVTDLVPKSQISGEDLQNNIQRLYYDSREQSKTIAQQLNQKYVTSPTSGKKKPRSELDKYQQDLYKRCMEQSQKTHEGLMSKYVDRLVDSKTITADGVKAMAERLSKPKGT